MTDDLKFKPHDGPYRYDPTTRLPEVTWRRIGPPPTFWTRLKWRLSAAAEAWRDAA